MIGSHAQLVGSCETSARQRSHLHSPEAAPTTWPRGDQFPQMKVLRGIAENFYSMS